MFLAWLGGSVATGVRADSPGAGSGSPPSARLDLAPGDSRTVELGALAPSGVYSLVVSTRDVLAAEDRVAVTLAGHAHARDHIIRTLHAGDPDFTLIYRPERGGKTRLTLKRAKAGKGALRITIAWRAITLGQGEASALEAEPNDAWDAANPLVLGQAIHGSADDVDFLYGPTEDRPGRDWFRFDYQGGRPALVFFELELSDRDVPANLALYTVDSATGKAAPYASGKDPMEVPHDRQRVRMSKFMTRTLVPGRYYLEVDARDPEYVLRTRVLAEPPYDQVEQSVEAGVHYILAAGDAWLAQIPRGGSRSTRAMMLHETAQRCTACHATSFPAEAALAARAAGYAIAPRESLRYLAERIAHSPTPLYGEDGLYWQRYIAIPLEAQGAQGSVLADYERLILGKSSPYLARFGAFLEAAWFARSDLPADADNGVRPLDGKFSQAWRSARVLGALAARGEARARKAADRIAVVAGDIAADKRVEGLQDRVDRLQMWQLIDPKRFAGKIARERGAILRFANRDGGWNDRDTEPGPSSIAMTGQIVCALIETGLSPEHPAIVQAVRYLLAQQQPFGGWFQDDDRETFRTPMRETRHAILALARARPKGSARGWGSALARPPRMGSMVETLADLESAWEVPETARAAVIPAIVKLLDHPEPFVRSAAASALGRLDAGDSAPALARALGDDSKLVARSAARALRALGAHPHAAIAIDQALQNPDPRVRRGAARVFSAQFFRLDERLDLLRRLVVLTRDPDLWTRLEAIRGLTQWFYRTNDPSARKAIVTAFLQRLAIPEHPVVRANLSQGLYIMLDENLGGSVSLRRNLDYLPPATRSSALAAREQVERVILLEPLLETIAQGNALARSGALAAFDGAFLEGRAYARKPESMIDVGNDREFSFLARLNPNQVQGAIGRALPELRDPVDRKRALALARFLDAPLADDESESAPAPAAPLADTAARPGETSFARFKRVVNPLLYARGEDGYSCADCHGNHAILRVVPAERAKPLDDASIRQNLASVYKTIDRGDPRSSLLLRKPRSPSGQGEQDARSPTGMTHAGGMRWDADHHPAYRAILEWISSLEPPRDATRD